MVTVHFQSHGVRCKYQGSIYNNWVGLLLSAHSYFFLLLASFVSFVRFFVLLRVFVAYFTEKVTLHLLISLFYPPHSPTQPSGHLDRVSQFSIVPVPAVLQPCVFTPASEALVLDNTSLWLFRPQKSVHIFSVMFAPITQARN